MHALFVLIAIVVLYVHCICTGICVVTGKEEQLWQIKLIINININ